MDTLPASLVEPFSWQPFSAIPWREVPVPPEDEVAEDGTDDEPPAQTWKHPDDGKEMPERDREIPLKP